ncbi:putative DNA-binding domain-containing protein [Giardia duodenalis]|uniref:DNA-binding domain-containing protein n=1 Tax=Giardia intestinalis (strain ATCC 50803 / WB clone C6) TaxID=184922 RepID=D3KGY7_GIAIC|nr:putative DNA-binding domain-containing protein [Giardia intestinalis]KAE8301344.1 putative DNA-binding domain-containing protein [Giardia intestinalis]
MTLRPLPESLRYDDLIDFEEDKETEFKALQDTKNLIREIRRYSQIYLNAFINTNGGHLFFGIDDSSRIRGFVLSNRQRDQIRLSVSTTINQMTPQIDSKLYSVKFIPIIGGPQITPSAEKIYRCVIAITMFSGKFPVYFTSPSRQYAYMRCEGSITRMRKTIIESRVTLGRPCPAAKIDREISAVTDDNLLLSLDEAK